MIAPACPIRRPFGAVWPAMNPTTGFRTICFTKAAAFCSSVPPISPSITIASVPGSSWNARSTSMKLVPMIGSPPMPTQVLCPIPYRVRWFTTS